jgi:hypothetical protein
MKRLALLGATLALTLGISGCSLFGSGETVAGRGNTGAAVADATLRETAVALKKARSIGGEWRDTKKKLIKKSKAAASKGDFKQAIELAREAKFQAEMGYKQAMSQKNAGPWLF